MGFLICCFTLEQKKKVCFFSGTVKKKIASFTLLYCCGGYTQEIISNGRKKCVLEWGHFKRNIYICILLLYDLVLRGKKLLSKMDRNNHLEHLEHDLQILAKLLLNLGSFQVLVTALFVYKTNKRLTLLLYIDDMITFGDDDVKCTINLK